MKIVEKNQLEYYINLVAGHYTNYRKLPFAR
jgi:hypothetical protein